MQNSRNNNLEMIGFLGGTWESLSGRLDAVGNTPISFRGKWVGARVFRIVSSCGRGADENLFSVILTVKTSPKNPLGWFVAATLRRIFRGPRQTRPPSGLQNPRHVASVEYQMPQEDFLNGLAVPFSVDRVRYRLSHLASPRITVTAATTNGVMTCMISASNLIF